MFRSGERLVQKQRQLAFAAFERHLATLLVQLELPPAAAARVLQNIIPTQRAINRERFRWVRERRPR